MFIVCERPYFLKYVFKKSATFPGAEDKSNKQTKAPTSSLSPHQLRARGQSW